MSSSTPGTPPSAIWLLEEDDPLSQDADYLFDANDRAYIDSQIRGVQSLILQALLLGQHCTWFPLDNTSAAAVPGEVVCSAGTAQLTQTRALATPLAAAGGPTGVVIVGAAPGGKILVALKGEIPASITGLPGNTGKFAKVNTATAKLEEVSAISSGDFAMGTVDTAGNLTIGSVSGSVSGTGVTSTGTIPGTNVYGDGSDGTATCDGTTSVTGMGLSGGKYTLARDCYFANLTINTGISVDGGGFRLFVRDTLINNGHFGVDGGDAAGGTTTGTPGVGGGGGLSGTKRLGGGYPGDGGITSNALGGYGSCGDGAFGTPGGTNSAVQPDATLGGWRDLTTMSGWIMGPGLNPGVVILKGGAGGIEGSHNGTCCGGGGGVGIILARILQGNGSFTSRGGQGAVCTSYPLLGGNGGGGFLMLVTRDVTGWTGTTDVSGGAPYGYTGGGPTTYNILAGGAGQVLQVTA